jgi:tetratricopeptide (TPR) repeat protein
MLRIDVNGSFAITKDGEEQRVTGPAGRALIAWLVLNPGPQPRAKALAATKANRMALFYVRKALGDGLLEEEDKILQLADAPLLEIPFADVLEAERPDSTIEVRKAAYEILDAGALFEGLSPQNTTPWLDEALDRFDDLAVRICVDLANEFEAAGAMEDAIHWTTCWMSEAPLHEEPVRSYVRRLGHVGRDAQALDAAEKLIADRHAEGMEPPSSRFLRLVDDLRAGRLSPRRQHPVGYTIPVASETFLVGRNEVVKTLRECLRRSVDGRQVAIVQGRSGVGKTRICREIADWWAEQKGEDGAAVLYGRFDGERKLEYSAFAEALEHYLLDFGWDEAALREHLGTHGEHLIHLLPELADRLPGMEIPSQVDPGVDRANRFAAVLETFQRIAEAGPMLLVLDDCHWAEPSSLALLGYLVRETSVSSLLILCAAREDTSFAEAVADLQEDHPQAVTVIPLKALDEEETTLLAEYLLDRPPSTDELDHHLKPARGTPMRIEQACTAIATAAPGDEPLSLIERLHPDTQAILAVAALIGSTVDAEILAGAAERGPDAVARALAEAAEAKVLLPRGDGTYEFAHALQRDDWMPEGTGDLDPAHQAASRRAAVLSEARREKHNPSQLARLWIQAGDRERAVEFLGRAAKDQALAHAYEDAVMSLRRALSLLPEQAPNERHCELLLALGEALWDAGHFGESEKTFGRAVELASTPEQLAEAALGMAGRLGFDGVTSDHALADLLERALDRLDVEDSPLRARVLACAGQALTFSAARRNTGMALAMEAEAMGMRLAEASDDDREVLVDVLCRTCWATWTPDNLDQRVELADRLVTLAQAVNRPARLLEGRILRICGAMEKGDVAAARVDLRECRALADQLRRPYYLALVRFAEGMFAFLDGDVDEAVCRQALEEGGRQDHPGVMQLFGAQMLYVYLVQQRTVELTSASRDLSACYSNFAAWRLGHALIRIEAGDLDDARTSLEMVVGDGLSALPRDMFWFICMDHVTRVACALTAAGEAGREGLIADSYEALKPFASRYVVAGGAVAVHCPVAFDLGLLAAALGERDEALAHFSRARRLADAVGDHHTAAEARVQAARITAEDDPMQMAGLLDQLEQATNVCAERGYIRLASEIVAVVGEAEIVAAAWDETLVATVERIRATAERIVEDALPAIAGSKPWRRARTRVVVSGAKRGARGLLALEEHRLETLLRTPSARSTIFGRMAGSYAAEHGFGFAGEIAFRLESRHGTHDICEWTFAVQGRRARHEPGMPEAPAVSITMSWRSFVRLLAQDLNPVKGWLDGDLTVDGDPILAARLVEMFGGQAALVGIEQN